VASVTLYDAETGASLAGDADPPDPVVEAENHEEVTFALDPRSDTAVVRFVVEPGSRQLVARVALEEDDDLQAIYRAIQSHFAGSEFTMAPPGTAPAHLNVFHYLAAPDPTTPDAEIRAHLVSTDESISAGVHSAAEAVSVVAFFRDRAPWKTVAVQGRGAAVSAADADVVVTVDTRYDDLTWVSRDESWADEDAVPDDIDVAEDTDEADDDADEAVVPDFTPDSTGVGDQPEDVPSVVRIYDGESGEVLYDSKQTADAPDAASERARQRYGAGQALVVDPTDDVVRARLQARGAGVDRGFFVEYDHPESTDDLLGEFVEELSLRVDDLGVAFDVDVGDAALDYEKLTGASPARPEALSAADVDWLARTNQPATFAAPDGATAFALAVFLLSALDGEKSVALSTSGRTDDLVDVDVVVGVDAGLDDIEPRGETVTRLEDCELREDLTDVGGAVEALVGRIDEVTGTLEARQRVFAAALSGDALATRGLTVAPVDDRPLYRRRKQARYLALYLLVLAGVAAGVETGRLEPLASLPEATYTVEVAALEGPLSGPHEVGGAVVIGGVLAALLGAAYWLFGYPLGPLSAARALLKTVRKQVTGGAGSGTVPSYVRELSDPVQSSLEDLHDDYQQLADVGWSVAAGADGFGEFLEAKLLTGAIVPDVSVVDREQRWRDLLVGMVVGAAVGTVLAAVVLGVLVVGATVAARDPSTVFDVLVGAAGLAVLASVLKALVVRFGSDRSPRWPLAR
jgi:hypothetical protein